MPARALAAAAVSLFVVTVLAPAASAEPQRLASDPQEGAELDEAPEEVSITFSEPLEDGSELEVIDECERRIDDGSLQISVNEMSVGIAEESSGIYTVAYSAVGPTGTAEDSFTFTVHGSAVCDASSGGHHGEDGGSGGGGGGHGGGHRGGSGGGGNGGAKPGHGGDGAAHNKDSSHGPSDGGTAHGTGEHAGGLDAIHTADDAGDHSAGRGRLDEPRHGSRRGTEVTATNSQPASPFVSAAAPEAPTEMATPSWKMIAALAIAGLFGVAGGWVLRGAFIRRSSRSS